MNKKVIYVVIALIVLILILIGLKIFNKPKDKKESKNYLDIPVKINAGIPFKWEYEIEDENIVKFVKTETEENKNNEIVGGPVITHYIFEGLNSGSTTIKFKLVSIVDGKVDKEDIYHVDVDSGNNITFYLEEKEGNIEIKAKEGSLSNKGATFVLSNNTNKDYTYGPEYVLEKESEGKYYEIMLNDPMSWNSILYTIQKSNETLININWETSYGELRNGKYRLVKTVYEKSSREDTSKKVVLYAEFEIK